jgi:4-amino-4-deoxy-L-arabinose transferase-like glycosyltransferase
LLAVLSIYALEANGRRLAFPIPFAQADQSAYLHYAKKMRESGYAFVGDRNRMPVFPFLLSRLYRPGESEADVFTRAQAFCVILSVALLLILAAIFRHCFPRPESIALVIATAFGVFVYRAGIVQVEPLFFVVNFGAFLLLLQMLLTPHWWLALLAGVILGLAFLTKASALPAWPCWGAAFIAQSFEPCRTTIEQPARYFLKRFTLLILMSATFLLVIWPYIWTSKQRYGEFFYNVNSAHYMWCDSWPEALSYSDRLQGPPVVNPAAPELPSFAKYWRQHSTGEMIWRLLRGFLSLATRNFKAMGYFKYVVALGVSTLVLSIRRRARARELLARQPFAVIFCLLYFGVYLILYAWYNAVVTDSRFVLTLFLPFVFVASLAIQKLARDENVALGRWTVPIATTVAAGMIGLAVIDILFNARSIV